MAQRLPIIAVLGGGQGSVPQGSPPYELAVRVGDHLARSGAILLCGGGNGIMEAASKGAKKAGGKVLAIMPSSSPEQRRANPYVDEALYTGLGDGRNFLTAGLPDAAIAMAGEAGTLSEIGLALKLETPLVLCDAWQYLVPHLRGLLYVDDAASAVAAARSQLPLERGYLTGPVRTREMPAQEENIRAFVQTVLKWSR